MTSFKLKNKINVNFFNRNKKLVNKQRIMFLLHALYDDLGRETHRVLY